MDETKTILLTGCSTGIGRHCAMWLSRREGWRVLASARKPADVEELNEHGVETLRIDVDDSDSVREGFDEALGRFGGRLDAVFNNAGFGIVAALEDTTREAFREVLETNVLGLHEVNRHALRVMRRQGHGRIVFNSSVLGFVTMRHRGAYNASKHAVEAIASTLRLELAGSGVHAISIQPGPIISRFRDNALAMHAKHVDAENSAFRDEYRRMEESWREDQRRPREAVFTLGPEAVYAALVKAIESDNPKPLYRVTVPTSLFWWLRRLLPIRVLDRSLSKV